MPSRFVPASAITFEGEPVFTPKPWSFDPSDSDTVLRYRMDNIRGQGGHNSNLGAKRYETRSNPHDDQRYNKMRKVG